VRCSGHAAALLSEALYVVGGGNNSAGCADLVCLDLSGLATGQPLAWSTVASAEPRSAIASEGALLTAAPLHTQMRQLILDLGRIDCQV
jgi:hypothetical protein